MDKLVINNIKLSTLIGVHAWEQQCPQTLYLDLAFQTDAHKIAQHDDITFAIDYDKVVQYVLSFAAEYQFQLIETFANHLAQEILDNFTSEWVQVTLRKPGALKQAKDVTLIIERTKNS